MFGMFASLLLTVSLHVHKQDLAHAELDVNCCAGETCLLW